jgi:uncharacterized protein YdhG (YjbR/CyaY superfamily)
MIYKLDRESWIITLSMRRFYERTCKEGYAEGKVTFGFSEEANLDEGGLWPIAFALKELTA